MKHKIICAVDNKTGYIFDTRCIRSDGKGGTEDYARRSLKGVGSQRYGKGSLTKYHIEVHEIDTESESEIMYGSGHPFN
ncbi:hypothetical protein ACS2BX_25785 [Bacillus cereus group sp. BceL300]|uniref:hypothetical protein n=1 Tax=Bacillus cereus group TaxID=86661 RepID=UPI00144427D7|nr:hypothetical protein [Bacillus cereus]NKW77395.1 hypothetical protein [Bacillus cereus]NKX14812.1 hypothetical protein [Bacillus cereus]